MRRTDLAPILAALVAVSACAKARPIAEDGGGMCTRCHGGVENDSGAPPMDARGDTDPRSRAAGAHTSHVQGGALGPAVACGECHPDPRVAGGALHMNGFADVRFGATGSAGGTVASSYDEGVAGCRSVYCHGAFRGGNTANEPLWTATGVECGSCHGDPTAALPALPVQDHAALADGSTQATCHTCHPATVDASGNLDPTTGAHVNGAFDTDPAAKHPAGWLDESSADFHGRAAARDVATCLRCHAEREPARVTTKTCSSCHDALANGADWTRTCNTCHGSANNAAPPRDTAGNLDTTALGVGAHQAHLAGGPLAAPLDCSFCHEPLPDVMAPGHLDGAVHVTGYSGDDLRWSAAVKDPGFSPSTATCATSYCHGAFRGGNAANAPTWTRVGQGQADCGTCHGLPPPAPHPVITGGVQACFVCHPGTVDESGDVLPVSAGGKHLDGVVDAEGAHPSEWRDPASSGFHAFSANAGLEACQRCHGADLSGGAAGVACAECHGAGWKTTCTMCHGGSENATGAPPKATWGNRTPAGAANVRVGAHSVHVSGTARAPAIACTTCHPTPASALDTGHIDGATATVTFSGVALPEVGTATWDRTGPTCSSTWCHGNFRNGKTANQPVWTGGPSQGACGTCHGLPPGGSHPVVSTDPTGCITCHGKSIDASGTLIPPSAGGTHLDGHIDAGHSAAWIDPKNPGFHAFSANRGLSGCTTCHGTLLDGGTSGVACADCHRTGWDRNCTMCHGGDGDATGAPPRATWGNGSPADTTNVRIGAHATHVRGTTSSPAFDCDACHVKPGSALDDGHVDAPAATVTFGGITAGHGTWERSTGKCSSTYCHAGTALGGYNTTPTWTLVGQGQALCTSCHNPMNEPHHVWHVSTMGFPCNVCHPGSTADVANKTLHVNGKKDVVLVDGTVVTTGWSDRNICNNPEMGCH